MGMQEHPNWFEPGMDYELPRFAYARQMGKDAAVGLSSEWDEAELLLQGIWRQEPGGLTWQEARGAIYGAWVVAREQRRR